MIGLFFVDVDPIGAHHEQSLRKFYIVDEAHQLILTVTKYASEVDDAEDREYPLEEECKDCYLHQ